MEKIKIEIPEFQDEWVNIQEFCMARKRIPYEEKEQMAEEIVQQTLL